MPTKKKGVSNPQEHSTQQLFLQRFREALPPGTGTAEELADVLNVSIDSAYRRMRCETELTIEEIYRITRKYPISMDEVFGNQGGTVTFGYTKLTDSAGNFEAYLTRLYKHLCAMNKFDNRHIHYVAEEMPMFYSFYTRKLCEFKLFYWQRSVLNVAEYQKVKFNWGLIPKKLSDLAYNCYLEYLKIPGVEIWTNETVLTVTRQVEFYFESGIISSEQALELLTEYRDMLTTLNKNADGGRKNISDREETYHLYASDVVLGTNCIFAKMGEARYSYISFNTMNSLTTTNPEFCDETEHWVSNLERKSTLISGVGEKQRYRFFSGMYKHVDDCMNRIRSND